MAENIAIPLILTLGIGVTVYALTLQKDEPRTSSTILSIIGATAGLLSIANAMKTNSTAGTANGVGAMASAFIR